MKKSYGFHSHIIFFNIFTDENELHSCIKIKIGRSLVIKIRYIYCKSVYFNGLSL